MIFGVTTRTAPLLTRVVTCVAATSLAAQCAYAQTGACCRPNGTCSVTDATTCTTSLGGDYLGDGEPCVANLCRGGCCRPDGTCSENIPRLNCEVNGGSYLGHQSNCAGVECPVLPNGACCQQFFCQEGFTQDACTGSYAGDDSTCLDCPGACCLIDDTCIQSTRGDCQALEGATFPGNLTTCPPDGCGAGACCFATTDPNGNCTGPIDPFNCAGSGGVYLGHDTDCDTSTCAPFGGACCCGSCFVTNQEECEGFSFCTFIGEGIDCASTGACPGDGACCPANGDSCFITEGASCASGGGAYQGEDSTCSPDPCAGEPVGACCSNAGCAILTQAACAEFGVGGDWHPGETCQDACVGTCCVQTPNPHCEFVTETVCNALGGQFLGINATCPQGCQSECEQDADCDDGNSCNGAERCLDLVCTPGDAPNCDDGNICTSDSCDSATGNCVATPSGDGFPCPDDGAECTADICEGGVCTHPPYPSSPPCTDDGDLCTIDECSGTECIHPLKCQSFDPCIIASCDPATGDCSSTPRECDDGNVCTSDSCDSATGNCVATPSGDGFPCPDDGAECTADICEGGVCTHPPYPSSPPCTDDGDLCTIDECSGTECVHIPTTCDDGNACTEDSCNPQTGCVNEDLDCDDGVDCTDDSCDPDTGACTHTPNDDLCLDEDGCTVNERCDPIEDCLFDAKNCADAHECTDDSCLSPGGECVHTPVHERCDDDKVCTDDTCDPNIGCVNGAVNSRCSDTVGCTVDLCRPNRPEADADGCVYDPDDNLCPTTDLCVPGRCDPIADCQFDPRECPDDGDSCTREFCDSSTGECDREQLCGACCTEGDPCIDRLPESECSNPLDTFMGVGTTCDTAPCGACCDAATGTCTDGITGTECQPPDKVFQGSNTTCVANPCLGACCDPGFTVSGCSSPVTGQQCAAIDTDTIFIGVGSDCATAPCGACCDPLSSDTGTSCLGSATVELCDALLYVYIGDQTVCDPDPCKGACCLPDGTCDVTTPEECPGDFRGNGTDCAELNPPCAPFTGGACCTGEGTCVDGTSADTCRDVHNGRHQDDDTRCENVDCSLTGACCLAAGTCVQSTESGCVGGNFQGAGTTCPDSCQGACCRPDGSCTVGSRGNCAGDYRGDGTNCAELNPPCEPFTGGACCLDDDTCVDGTSFDTCTEILGGRHQGDDTRCENVDCSLTGACCLDVGPCVQATEQGCVGGSFQGAGSACPDACPGACCLPDGSCTVATMQSCPGEFRGPGTDCAEINPACEPFGGACCTVNGCVDGLRPEQCASAPLNEFKGIGSKCDEVTCGGACCLNLGEPPCVGVETRPVCEFFGEGVYLGDGIICVETTCRDCTNDEECVNDDRCDGDEFCDDGKCSSTAPPTFHDNVDCTIDGCDSQTGVFHTPVDEYCDEGNPCREYFCDANTGCFHVSTCDDGDPCTIDVCTDEGVCVPVPVICADADSFFCNGGGVCVDGDCVQGGPPCNPVTEVCDEDRDVCTKRCASDAECDDGMFCNGAEICSLFLEGCVPGTGPCRREDQICDEAADRCVDICTTRSGECVLPGDGNGDGDVDMVDGGAIFNAFGQQVEPGHPAEALDIDRNGRIELQDFAMFVQNMNGPE